jgi:hypothetical protein
MTHLFTIQDDTVIIDKLAVAELYGNVAIKGDTITYGSVNINGDLTSQEITTDVLRVKRLITDTSDFGNWSAKTFADLNGKGITWNCEEGSTQLIYRTDNRLWTSSNIDLLDGSAYMIDNTAVLSATKLGPTVTKSNLRQVGALTALSVIGAASIGEFAFFDNTSARLGLGTETPNSAISIIDNNVEISIGSPAYNLAVVGTYSNHDLSFISDNIPRMTIKNSGEIHIGDKISNLGVLRVYGTVYANSVVVDNRIERSNSLEFNPEVNTNDVFNKGLVWNDPTIAKQLILIDNPSRIWSSEPIDIAAGNSYYINGDEVISSTTLGLKILNSSLVKVGNLKELTVDGDTILNGSVTLTKSLNVQSIQLSSIVSSDAISILNNEINVLSASATDITIGALQRPKPVKIFGPVSIGINNPDPTVNFSVNGNVSFNNKKFITDNKIPLTGVFSKGDICWNETPTETGYVGWVCIQSGSPGEWRPFGLIGA